MYVYVKVQMSRQDDFYDVMYNRKTADTAADLVLLLADVVCSRLLMCFPGLRYI